MAEPGSFSLEALQNRDVSNPYCALGEMTCSPPTSPGKNDNKLLMLFNDTLI